MDEPQTLLQARDQIALLEEQNARLRRLLDNAGAPTELRHRLRSTLSLLRSIIHGTASDRRTLEDYVAHLDDRLDAIIRAQGMADTNGGVELRSFLTDQMLLYRIEEGAQLTIDGPDITLTPRMGQAIALALHELTANSIEFGSLGGSGHVAVHWTVDDKRLSLTWRETGGTIQPSDHIGFGRDFIINGLPYQLSARTSYTLAPGLLVCAVSAPLEPSPSRQKP
jgi:two-component sensor histidine kinase